MSNFPVLVVTQLDDYQLTYKGEGQGGLRFSDSAGLVLASWTAAGSGGLSLGGGGFVVGCGQSLQNQPACHFIPAGNLVIRGDTRSRFGNNRTDFQFETACGHSQLAHEVESYDPITGTLTAWVSVPTDPNDTDLYFYYGGPDGSPNPSAVWNNYAAVYHSNNYLDASGQGVNGTAPSFTAGNIGSDHRPAPIAAGKVNNGLRFDGNDYFTTSNDSINSADDVTAEAWVRPTSTFLARQVVLSRGKTDNLTNGTGWNFSLGYDEAGRIWAQVQTVCNGAWTKLEVIGSTKLTVNQWAYITAIWRSGQGLSVYLNGVIDGTQTSTAQVLLTGGGNQIGRRDQGLYLKGDLDEVRLSKIARPTNWLRSTYNNINDPSGFTIVGIQENALHLWGCPTVIVNRNAYVPTGGLAFSGAASTALKSANAVGSGGLTIGGGAPIRLAATGAGGLALSGTATNQINSFRAIGSGGLTLSNSATMKPRFNLSGAGKLTLAGSSNVFTNRLARGSGGLKLGSTAPSQIKRFNITGNGGLIFGGTSQPARMTWGTITLGGSAGFTRSQTIIGSGGLILGSSAPAKPTLPISGSGGLLLGSSASSQVKRFNVAGNGGLIFGGASQPARMTWGTITLAGSSTAKINLKPTARGGLRLLGSGLVTPRSEVIPTGGLKLGSSAQFRLTTSFTPSGGLSLSGIAKPLIRVAGVGGLALSGIAPTSIRVKGSGGLTLAGTAGLSRWVGTGGLTLSGSATSKTPNFHVIGSGGLVFVRSDQFVDFGGITSCKPALGGTANMASAINGKITVASKYGGSATAVDK